MKWFAVSIEEMHLLVAAFGPVTIAQYGRSNYPSTASADLRGEWWEGLQHALHLVADIPEMTC